jgi:hypothetical protein
LDIGAELMASTFQRAFASGELAPALAARADLARYAQGLRTCRNFVVQKSGGITNRAGLRFVGRTRDNSTATQLLRYVSETAGESILIEAAPGYLRFYKNGALITLAGVVAWNGATGYQIGDIVLSGGVNYYCVLAHTNHVPPNATYWYAMPGSTLELPSPFGAAGLTWTQSGNTLTLTSQLVPPYELIYLSATHWVIRRVSTAPTIGPPTGVAAVAGAVGARNLQYVVTSAAVDTYEESVASVICQLLATKEGTPDVPNVVSWVAPAGVPAPPEYYVYEDPYGNGTFGFIGTATGVTSFKDIGQLPNFDQTPPLPRVIFNAAGDYPNTAAYYQQRRFFANTLNAPDAVYGSRVGFPSNFNVSQPLQDDDAITFRIAGTKRNPVRHLVGLKALVVMTDGGEWTIGQAKTPLTPSDLPADQELFVGAFDAVPVIIGNSIIYVQARGSIVRDVQFDLQVDGFNGRDLTVFSDHLFKGYQIPELDYQQDPDSIVWCCRSDGTLLGLTYVREQDVWGWHRHDSGASCMFEDVCVVPEADEDVVYVLVRRTIGGAFVRYIERLESRRIANLAADGFFVDSGLTYSGAPATTIAGLDHLNGQIVAVVCDGVVVFDGDPTSSQAILYTVSGGTILTASSVIHAGLPITFDAETLDLDVGNLAVQVRDKRKRVNAVSLVLQASCRTFKAGPDAAHLTQVKVESIEANQAGVPFTGIESLNMTAAYNDYGRVFIRHTDPSPLTILGVLPNTELGG